MKKAQLRCLALVLIASCAVLVLVVLFHVHGASSNEWLVVANRLKPIRSIDAFIEGQEEASGGTDATMDLDPSNNSSSSSSNLKTWLAELNDGASWERGSFCDSYFGHTFSRSTEICNRVQCLGAEHSSQMATCIVKGLAMVPRSSNRKKKTGLIRDLADSNSFWLARGTEDANIIPCPGADLSALDNVMEKDDYARTVVRSTVLGTPKVAGCQRLFRGTTFFYMGMETHIYFKFMAWYNLFKTLLDHSDTNGTMRYQIVRFPEGWEKFSFPEFERRLFPEVIPLDELQNEVSCFEKVVLSPWAYAASPFRCRIDKNIRRRCSPCNGHSLVTELKLFRERVLDACGLPSSREKNLNKSVAVIKRRAYVRHQEDKLGRFKRVWKNADEFVSKLSKEVQGINVTGVYAEELPICTQIELAYRADILVGLHGAGLVHLWWMQEDSHVIEFMPRFESGNIAFPVLSKLLGVTMHSMEFSASSNHPVTVPLDRAIGEIRKLL